MKETYFACTIFSYAGAKYSAVTLDAIKIYTLRKANCDLSLMWQGLGLSTQLFKLQGNIDFFIPRILFISITVESQ